MDGVTETSLLHHDVSASYEMHVADEEDQLQFEVLSCLRSGGYYQLGGGSVTE